jgi:hypothetical protein
VKRLIAFAVTASFCFMTFALIFAASGQGQGRGLVIEEKAGHLVAKYGVSGKRLDSVNPTVDAGSRPKISFATGVGNAVNLELVKETGCLGRLP